MCRANLSAGELLMCPNSVHHNNRPNRLISTANYERKHYHYLKWLLSTTKSAYEGERKEEVERYKKSLLS